MRLLLLLLAVMALNRSTLCAQQFWDAQGREFWIAFEENAGTVSSTPNQSFRLYLMSPYRSWVTVEAMNSTYRTTILLLPDAMQEIILPDNIELIGSEQPDNRVVHVTATNDIVCSALNTFTRSSDAFLCVPAQMLDTVYTIVSYPSHGFFGSGTPSQFAVMATANNTSVTITQSAESMGHAAGVPYTITLQRGQVYQVQARLPSSFGPSVDLTGTHISASAAVGIVAGHVRANIPYTSSSTGDFLCEYQLPVAAYDTSFVVAPHAITPQVNSVFRIVATRNGTTVRVNGVAQILQAGQLIENKLNRVNVISCTAPVIVASFEQSDVGSAGNNDDPFMMLIAATTRFRATYRLTVPTMSAFTAHLANVVVPTTAISSLQIDGSPVLATFAVVPGTIFSWATVVIRPGGHVCTCRAPFGISLYGTGQYDSYGELGGCGLLRTAVDSSAPNIIFTTAGCDTVVALITEDSILNSGVDSIYVIDSLSSNYRVNIPSFQRGVDSVQITITPTATPARTVIVARDRAGNNRSTSVVFPAMRMVSATGTAIERRQFAVPYCDTLILRNLGPTLQTLTGLRLQKGDAFSLSLIDALPRSLQPARDSARVLVCYHGSPMAVTDAILMTTAGCSEENMMLLEGGPPEHCRAILRHIGVLTATVGPNPIVSGVPLQIVCAPVSILPGIVIELVDMFGRTMLRGSFSGPACSIDTDGLMSGVYTCIIRSGSQVVTQRVAVAR